MKNINDHPIENLMESTMENLKDMIDVNTIIGTPVETKDGTCIIPISKVSFGFASGGSEFESTKKDSSNTNADYPFAGGSGAGVSVKPVSFLVVRKDSIRLLPVEQDSTYDRIVDTIPQVLEMFKDVCKDFKSNKNCEKKSSPFCDSNAHANESPLDSTYYESDK
ncbi:MAG: GerW family sporulation protein [Clostridium sp.]|uniref:GerW family sporulation protein n=1 Tax=Clostridium sp. TaxID=1506 RepID=UPI003F2E2A16